MKIGIVGGTGELGHAIAVAVLERFLPTEEVLRLSNSSGALVGFEQYSNVRLMESNQQLVDACDLIVLCVPPAQFDYLAIDAKGKLMVTLVSGITIEEVRVATNSQKIVRATSSPAAAFGLAYSPWVKSSGVTREDCKVVTELFFVCGKTDLLDVEQQIDVFTVLTGPVPGYVAYFAECLIRYALKNGVAPDVADKAIKQLFLASGRALSETDITASQQVHKMIDYAGVTAAGLEFMNASEIQSEIWRAFDTAIKKSQNL